MLRVQANARVGAVGEHGGQVVGLTLNTDPAVQFVDEHVGLVVGPGWQRGGRVGEEGAVVVAHGVVELDIHGVVFEDVGDPVKDAIAGVEVVIGVALSLGDGGECEGGGGGEEGEKREKRS